MYDDEGEHLIHISVINSELWIRANRLTKVEVNKWDPIAYLKRQTTKELLGLRDQCHKFHGYYNVFDSNSVGISIDQVHDELKAREHVPNKNEARLLRRLMAQNKMTEAEVRAVPKFKTLLAQSQDRRVVDKETMARYKHAAPDCWVTKKMIVLPNG